MRNDKGQFEKGNQGRKAGSRNKTTEEIRKKFQALFESQLEDLQKDFKSLTAKDRIRYTIELAKFVLPTLKQVEIEQTKEEDTPLFVIDLLDVDEDKFTG